ncbi:hypothetical protein POVCU1_006550 [Plasmodium ovale curtisi]|uniref:Uncharacterized protein n=1 Tax=Plasmodium ovale curtisi TaxID=864141 RepID=A0A1A8VS60_PLAOA|nr:hypothetical protein POVCU1_006550 [Plasmodium ovale curtisi]
MYEGTIYVECYWFTTTLRPTPDAHLKKEGGHSGKQTLQGVTSIYMYTNVYKCRHSGERFANRVCENSPQCIGGGGAERGLALNVHLFIILERVDFVELGI